MNFSFKILFMGWKPFFKEEQKILLMWIIVAEVISFLFGIFSIEYTLLYLAIIIAYRKIVAGGFCCNDKTLHNKTVIITGSNTGIGRETALDLANRGAKLILACRDVKKAENVASEIKMKTNLDVSVEKLNLASFDSINSFAKRISQNQDKIDYLINNAGIMMCPYMETEDGLEMQMGVNHFGHFLLTLLMLPLLRKSQDSRIINLSSMGHNMGDIPFDDMKYEKGYDQMKAYGNSKLANILHVRHLAKLLKGTNIQVFSLHPGVVQSELGRHLPFKLSFVYSSLLSFFTKTTKEGAQTTVYCATEAIQEPPYYYSDCMLDRPSNHALSDANAERLWKLSEKVVNMTYNEL